MIELEIFFHNEESRNVHEFENPLPLSKNDIKKMTFMRIDVVGPYIDENDNDREYSRVYSSGDYFICNMDYEALKNKLKEWKERW